MDNLEQTEHHIVVLGAGPGGYEASLAGAQLGAKVTLVERSRIGGAAVMTDVVPSKTLIVAAEIVQTALQAPTFGVTFGCGDEDQDRDKKVKVNLAKVHERVARLAQEQSDDMVHALRSAGVNIVYGQGSLESNDTVRIDPSEKHKPSYVITADTIILAVGASPRILPEAKPDGQRIFTWAQVYNLTELPEHLVIVGSGVTGAEFASAYQGLGVKVTLISNHDQVLPGEDIDAARALQNVFMKSGVNVLLRSRAEKVQTTSAGVLVTLADGRTIEASHCLMAVGSLPNTQDLGLEKVGVECVEHGKIRVNRVARTSLSNIYAVGDCTNVLPLASVAAMQGRTAVFHAMGDEVNPIELRNVASNIFTRPEIATVGWKQVDVECGIAHGKTGKLSLEINPRAKMLNIVDGFVKLFARVDDGAVIGGVIVSPRASELIFPVALAVEHRLTVDQVARAFAVYPSLSGSITDVARALHKV